MYTYNNMKYFVRFINYVFNAKTVAINSRV